MLNEVDFEKRGDVHRDLIALLRNESPHFAELIDKQVNSPVPLHTFIRSFIPISSLQ